MLSLVEECLDLIVDNGKAPVDLSRIDFDDPKIYDMICIGDTIGTFQIESRAQIQMLPRTQPRRLEDLIVQVAIVRPGPIVGGAVKPYVAHRQQIADQLPADRAGLRPPAARCRCWQETHGVILYQEQVIEVAMALAGFTAGQADALRRVDDPQALPRRDDRALDAVPRRRGTERRRRRRSPRPSSRSCVGFAEYGFPKAHAAAFAMLAYQSLLAEVLLPGRVLLRPAQQPADGLLPLARADQRRQAARRPGLRAGCQQQRRPLHGRGSQRRSGSDWAMCAALGEAMRPGGSCSSGRPTDRFARWPISCAAARSVRMRSRT